MAAHKKVDYDRIEPGWRAGLLSPHQLAAIYTKETGSAVSHAAIIKHFKKLGVPRDLSAKIKAKSDAMVTAAMVTEKVTSETIKRDRDIIDGGAEVLTSVRLSHRRDIQRSRSIVMRLMDEMELQSGPENAALLSELGELMRKPDDKNQDKLNDLYQKIVSLPSRAKTMRDLGESLRVLVALEREAFGLSDVPDSKPESSISDDDLDAKLAMLAAKVRGN